MILNHDNLTTKCYSSYFYIIHASTSLVDNEKIVYSEQKVKHNIHCLCSAVPTVIKELPECMQLNDERMFIIAHYYISVDKNM